jgi:circadian clock protein KaiC
MTANHALKFPRISTGVPGLDEVLGGGFPSRRMYLIQGDPGVGKTTLALQFLIEGMRKGESSLYITLSETVDEIASVAESHGWDLKDLHILDLSKVQENVQKETENTFFRPSHIELTKMSELLIAEVEKVKPDRAVLDSLSEMRMLAETPLRFRRQILQLKQFFAGRNSTVLLLDDRTSENHDLQVESIAHGVLDLLRTSPGYGISRRQILVRKIRGARFRDGAHDIAIKRGGIEVFPRLVAAEHHSEFVREPLSSGNQGLDALLGGGLDRGTATMIMGPPGTGKSTLAIGFVYAAAQRGEKIYHLLFDETLGTFLLRASELGLDLRPYIQSGIVRVQQLDPAEISPGELTARIRASVDEGVKIIVIDSINGYLNAMPEEKFLNLQLHELLAYLNQNGVTSIMILAQQGMLGAMQSKADLTYLSDSVVLLRYFEVRGRVRQAISILKKRSGEHERTIREFRISKTGIVISEPVEGLQGVLSGTPSFLPEHEGGKTSLDDKTA